MLHSAANSLFDTLALFTRVYHRPVCAAELTAGLPTPPGETAPPVGADAREDTVTRAAERAGLKCVLVKRALADLSPLVLPAILALADGTGCILTSISPRRCELLFADTGEQVHAVDRGELEQSYAGFTYLLGPQLKRVEERRRQLASRGHWLWQALWLSAPIYRDIVIASLFTNLFTVATPLFAMNVYDRVVPNGAMETLWVLSTGVVVVVILDCVLRAQRSYFVELAAKRSDLIVSSRLFEKVMDLRMEDGPRNTGAFAANLREFDMIRNFLTAAVLLVLVDLPFTALFLFVIWYIAGPLVWIPASIMGLLVIYGLAVRAPLKRAIAEVFEENARKNALLIEAISGLRDIKLNNAGGQFQWRWENGIAELARTSLKSRLLSASLSTVTNVLVQLDYVLIVICGVYLIDARLLTVGGLIASSILASRAIAPTGQVVGLLSGYEHAREAFASLCNIMTRRVENPPGVETFRKESLVGELELRDVSLAYPGSPRLALSHVSFRIRAGEHVALLGRNGSGKTSVQGVLLGFYRPQQGSVLIDGLDATAISPALLRRAVSCVPQDYTLFAGTLRDNIRLKVPHATDEAVLAAARVGNLEALIRSHPAGLDMPIEERGANLSGGQRQGVAIARAFVEEAPLVWLDEPTAAMDGAAEAVVKANLKRITAGKTLILTTHRNNLLDLVDRVLVMDQGRIAFDGTRDEFLGRGQGG